MTLDQIILENEQNGKTSENLIVVKAKLKELVNNHSEKVVNLLNSFGIKASITVPKAVIYSILVKHLALNSELRAAVISILLEQSNEFLNVSGQGMTIAGGALQAIGSVLSGLGRNQSIQAMQNGTGTMDEATRLKMEQDRQKQLEADRKKKNTNIAIGVTVGVIVLIGIILLIRHLAKQSNSTLPKQASVHSLNN